MRDIKMLKGSTQSLVCDVQQRRAENVWRPDGRRLSGDGGRTYIAMPTRPYSKLRILYFTAETTADGEHLMTFEFSS